MQNAKVQGVLLERLLSSLIPWTSPRSETKSLFTLTFPWLAETHSANIYSGNLVTPFSA